MSESNITEEPTNNFKAYQFMDEKAHKLYPDMHRHPGAGEIYNAGYLNQEDQITAAKMMTEELAQAGVQVPEGENIAYVYEKWRISKLNLNGAETSQIGKDFPIQEISPNEELVKQIEAARLATEALVNYALLNGASPESFSHLPQVWDRNGYIVMSVSELPGMAGITLAETGDSAIREDHVDFPTVFHESIHRAGHLRRIQTNGLKTAEIVAGIYGFTISGDNQSLIPLDEETLKNIPRGDRATYLEAMKKEVKLTSDIFTEGLVSLVVDKANGMTDANGNLINIPPNSNTYPHQTEIIKAVSSFLDPDPKKADAILIQVALSGDIQHLAILLDGQIPIPILMQEFNQILADSQARTQTQ